MYMELISLLELQNPYPNGQDSYGKTNGNKRLQGNYPSNSYTFDASDFETSIRNSIQIYEEGTFQFIIKFITDGTFTYHTTPSFIEKILAEKDNPYISEKTIPIITLNTIQWDTFSKESQFVVGEAYAEVEVTDTLDSKEDYLKYIDWLVKSEDGRSPLISTDKLGAWNVFGPTEDMGMSFQEQLDEMVSGNSRYTEFKSNNSIDESQKKILGVPPVQELSSTIEAVRSRIKKIRE